MSSRKWRIRRKSVCQSFELISIKSLFWSSFLQFARGLVWKRIKREAAECIDFPKFFFSRNVFPRVERMKLFLYKKTRFRVTGFFGRREKGKLVEELKEFFIQPPSQLTTTNLGISKCIKYSDCRKSNIFISFETNRRGLGNWRRFGVCFKIKKRCWELHKVFFTSDCFKLFLLEAKVKETFFFHSLTEAFPSQIRQAREASRRRKLREKVPSAK